MAIPWLGVVVFVVATAVYFSALAQALRWLTLVLPVRVGPRRTHSHVRQTAPEKTTPDRRRCVFLLPADAWIISPFRVALGRVAQPPERRIVFSVAIVYAAICIAVGKVSLLDWPMFT